MSRINLDIDELDLSSASIQQKINELESLNARFEVLIAQIKNSWEGKASEAYLAMILSYYNKAQGMIEILEEFKKYVDSAINKFSELDSRSAVEIRSIF